MEKTAKHTAENTVAIVGIGTELTTGQIFNGNAQWISSRCKLNGLPTSIHLVVPDDRKLILKSLQQASECANLIFVTGGLGPTVDDFTRDIIAQWLDLPLLFDEGSMTRIERLFSERGLVVREIQRQQCYFPKGSQILENRLGTANGFFIQGQDQNTSVFVLPGPPKEIEAIWQDHIQGLLEKTFQVTDPLVTSSWDTIGYGESEIANRFEAALQGCDYERGYRVHLPFVEVKLTYRKSQDSQAKKWIDRVEEALTGLVFSRDGFDTAEELSRQLGFRSQISQVSIIDQLSQGYLLSRLKSVFENNQGNFVSYTSQHDHLQLKQEMRTNTNSAVLTLKPTGVDSAKASILIGNQMRSTFLNLDPRHQILKSRSRLYFAELAMKFWLSELS